MKIKRQFSKGKSKEDKNLLIFKSYIFNWWLAQLPTRFNWVHVTYYGGQICFTFW